MTSTSNGVRSVVQKRTQILGGWRTGQTVPITPTIIIFPDDFSLNTLKAMQTEVKNRLYSTSLSGLLSWAILSLKDEASTAAIRELVNPFLDFGFWRQMTSLGITKEVPTPENPTPLQIILICNIDRMGTLAGETLEKASSMIKVATKGSNLTLVLIAIGNSNLDIDKVSNYWPRIRLQLEETGTERSKQDRLSEVIQTIITCLVSSELNIAIEKGIGLDKKNTSWIIMGASSILADIRSMQELFELLIWQYLLKKMTGGTLVKTSMANFDSIASGSRNQVKLYKEAVLDKILKLSTGLNSEGESWAWQYKTTEKIKSRKEISLFEPSIGSQLLTQLNSPTKDLNKFLFAQNQAWEFILRKGIADTVKDEYPKLLSCIAQWINTKNVGLMSSGLPSAIQAAETVLDELNSDDIYFDRKAATPSILSGNYSLLASAEADAGFLLNEHRRYKRFTRQIFSFTGLLIRIAASWPLLTVTFLALTRWTELKAALVAGIVILAISGIEWILWKNRAWRMALEIRKQAIDRIASTMLRIAAQKAQEYRLIVAARVKDICGQLHLAYTFILGVQEKVEKSLVSFDARFLPKEELQTIFRFTDFSKSREWASKAIDTLNSSDIGLINDVVENYLLSLSKDNGSPRGILFHLKGIVEEIEYQEFRAEQLQVYILADILPQLQRDKKWQWLYQGAQPLGGTRLPTYSFTFISVASDAALEGAFGRSSKNWGKDWLPIRSVLSNEICCLRGFIEEQEHNNDLA